MNKWVIILLVLVPASISPAADRCVAHVKDVRIEHIRQIGFAFPYWYGVGQLRQESACRSTPTAFDGGQGIAQFMPMTSQYIQSLMGEALNPYNPRHAIRMQAFYMSRIHRLENWVTGGPLWIDYQIYNGGKGNLQKEAIKAGLVDWDLMRLSCQRKKIQMKWGVLDLCDVNYSYSKQVEKYGNQYRRGPDLMRFW